MKQSLEEWRMEQFRKGVWLQCENEEQAKAAEKKKDPLQRLSEQVAKERRQKEESMKPAEGQKYSHGVIKLLRDFRDSYYHG